MSYLEDWLYSIKRAVKAIIDWADDSPFHLFLISVALLFIPHYWKFLLWYLVMPGSFMATYAVYALWRKYVADK